MVSVRHFRLLLVVTFVLFAGLAGRVSAQVSLTTLDVVYNQEFNTLPATGSATFTNNSTMPGWYHARTGTGTTIVANDGSSNAGNLYSFGTGTATDRAIGSLGSGNAAIGNLFWGVRLVNNTGATITSLDVSYVGEQWRNSNAAAQTIAFSYVIGAPGVTGSLAEFQTAGTPVAALNFTGPITGGTTPAALNGNDAANRVALSTTITGLSIPVGTEVMLRWSDPDHTGADHGLSVDSVNITPHGAPTGPNLTINDVALNEGNAGATTFTFTVSLSAPAGAGGVTFDIATADGTAVAPSDYTAKSLTAQTIPAGSSTYTFDVLVNGDTTFELNETFLVNVTNVTGATVTDGQGQGTINNDDIGVSLSVNDVTLNEGNSSTTSFGFTVSLSAPAGPGGVTFDITTAPNTATAPSDYTTKTLTGQTIPTGSSTYAFSVLVNGDTTAESNETFLVDVTNVTGAIVSDSQGEGTIVNDDFTLIHDVQGNGAATPIPGSSVTVEGIVVGNFQGTGRLRGFFLQEEDSQVDADPATSEGIFVFCSSCPTAVAEGQRVSVTGTVSEFNGMTEITASTAGSVVVTNAGNNLAQVTPATIDLPVVGVVNDYYEAREAMLVRFVDSLTVSEYFEMARFGHIELFEGGRPYQFAEHNTPNAANYTAHLAALDRRRVILDDDDNIENEPLTLPNGSQFLFHPRANGGLSVGTQGTDFFRGGDIVNNLTGVLDWSFAGLAGTDAWRIRPVNATPATFTVTNPRPAAAPVVGGTIKVAGMNMLNYFTTIDTTASNNSGTCGPSGTLDCRGADSTAELNRQRERASIVICTLNPDAAGLVEMQNDANTTVTDLIGAVNARCGGAHPYAFVNTGGTLGTDAIRVNIIYRTGVLSPVGSPLVDLNGVHDRPPTAQTFDVVDATNPAFGQRFTLIPNHFKSKGCGSASGGDLDAGDGASCYNATRNAQAARMLTWITNTVVPTAGDPDVIMVGDFNAYASEGPITALESGGFTDLTTHFDGNTTYSYVFDGQLGHLDYGFANATMLTQIADARNWHINADEIPDFNYNDEVRDTGEAGAFEEKADGSALVPPRVLFQPASPYRAADHDPVLIGLFPFTSADLSITKTDSPDPVTAGSNLTYTITVSNNGPDPATDAAWSDTLPAGTTFVSLPAVAGWSCTTPAVGAGGTISCTNATFAVGSAVFTLTVNVAPSTASGTVLSNTATVTSASSDPSSGNDSATATTTVATSASLSITKVDTPDPVNAGANLTYTITVTNAGPSNATNAALMDTLPVGTSFVSLTSPGGWSCSTPPVGSSGFVTCGAGNVGIGSSVFTLVVGITPSTSAGTVITNTATISANTTDPTPGDNSATATTTVATSADLSVTKVDTPDPVTAGSNLTYTITLANAGPSNAATVTLGDTLPAGTTFVSLASPGGWSCTTPTVGSAGSISCTIAGFSAGSSVFTLVVAVSPSMASGSTISNTATVSSATTDPTPGNNSATAITTSAASADVSVTKVDTPDPVTAGTNLTYTITVANAGPSDAFDLALADTLPAGTTFVSLSSPGGWSCTTPAVGGTGTVNCTNAGITIGNAVFTLVLAVDPSVTNGTVISNTATVSTSTTDPTPGNNSATATTTVGSGNADLSVTIADNPDPANAGSTITYSIDVTNAGPTNATSASLSIPLPAGTGFSSLAAAGGWSCTSPAVGATGTVTCTNASFGIATASFTLVVQVNSNAAPNSVVSTTATISSATTDPTPGNNSATATTSILAPSNVSGTKTAGGQFAPGSTVTYTIVLTNNGTAAQANNPGDEFTDILPAQLHLVSANASSGTATATIGTNTVTWNGSIPAGGSVTISIVATIDGAAPVGTTISNQGTISYDADGNGTNESTRPTDDSSQGGAADPTTFVIGAAAIDSIPTLDTLGLFALASVLGALGFLFLRRA